MLDGKTPAQKVEILTIALKQWKEMYALDPSGIVSKKIREIEEEIRDAQAAAKEQGDDEELTRLERFPFKDARLMSALELERQRQECEQIVTRIETLRDDCYDPMGRALESSKSKLFQCERVLVAMSNRLDEIRDELQDRNSQITRQQDATAKREGAEGAPIPAREITVEDMNPQIRPAIAFPEGEDPYEEKKKKKKKRDPLDSKSPILPPEDTGKKTREIELDE